MQNTITSSTFTKTELDALKVGISTHKNTVENCIISITAINQSISNFKIQSPQIIEAKKFALNLAESNLSQAEHNLENVKASLDTQKVSTSSQIEISEKALESARAGLESVKNGNAIVVQNAKTALDNAKKQLDSAQLFYSKLIITSPISGVITMSMHEVGDTVNQGSPLFIIFSSTSSTTCLVTF